MPPGYQRRAAEIVRAAGGLYISDEVQTGFGRTGTMFACEQAGIAPDLMLLSKGITGGFLPLAEARVVDADDGAVPHGRQLADRGLDRVG